MLQRKFNVLTSTSFDSALLNWARTSVECRYLIIGSVAKRYSNGSG